MGIWDQFTDVFTGRPAKDAAAQNAALFAQARDTGLANIGQGERSSEAALGSARNLYSDFGKMFSGRYSPAVNTYLGALGVRGPEAATAARSAFTTSPGYDFARDEGLKAVERSFGGRFSGNTLQALQDRGNQLANQEWEDWLTRLGGFVTPDYNAALASTTGQAGTYEQLPSIYTGAATNRANLGQNTARDISGTNDATAAAQLGGSANLWSLGLAAANLGANVAGGFAKPKVPAPYAGYNMTGFPGA